MTLFRVFREQVASRGPSSTDPRPGLGLAPDSQASDNSPSAVASMIKDQLHDPLKMAGRINVHQRAAATLLDVPRVIGVPAPADGGYAQGVVDVWRDPSDPDAGIMALLLSGFQGICFLDIVPIIPGTKVPDSPIRVNVGALGFSIHRSNTLVKLAAAFMTSSRIVWSGRRAGGFGSEAAVIYDFVAGREITRVAGADGPVIVVGTGDDTDVIVSSGPTPANNHLSWTRLIRQDLSVETIGAVIIPGQGSLRCRTLNEVFLPVTSFTPEPNSRYVTNVTRLVGGPDVGREYRLATNQTLLRTPSKPAYSRLTNWRFGNTYVANSNGHSTSNPGAGTSAAWQSTSATTQTNSVHQFAVHPAVTVDGSTRWPTQSDWARFPNTTSMVDATQMHWTGDLMAARVHGGKVQFVPDISGLPQPHNLSSSLFWR